MTSRASRARKFWVALLTGAGITALVAGTGTAVAAGTPSSDQEVSYLGLHFTVPASWPVIDLSPTTCVRFDQHAVYLGTPGQTQACPAGLIGRTEALLVQPGSASSTSVTDDTASNQITASTPTATVTATYRTDRATVIDALASAGLPAPTPAAPATPTSPSLRAHAAVATLPASATDGTGQGFDACSAPSTTDMATIRANSPFTNVGIYIGGPDQSCTQDNVSATWTSAESAALWHFLPIWVGPQALFNETADLQHNGATDADKAIANAAALGFGPGSLLYDDMEGGYTAAERGPALAYEAAWTAELHKRGYHSGVYGSAFTSIEDVVANYGGLATPDVVWTAHYNNTVTPIDAVIPAADFTPHRQAHQYTDFSGVLQHFGNVTIGIDADDLDVAVSSAPISTLGSGFAPAPPTRLLDTRNGTGAAKAKVGANGTLKLTVAGKAGLPSSATSVVLNVTVANGSAGSVLTVFPDGQALPTVSSLNFTAHQTVANLVTVPIVDGAVDFRNLAGTVDVVADLDGYYTSTGGQVYHGVTPKRALDTRNGTGAPVGPLGAGKSMTLTVAGVAGVPANVSAVIMNVTAANSSTGGFLTAYPSDATTVPTASNLNFTANQTIANLAIVPVHGGTVNIFNGFGTTQVVADIDGYFTPDLGFQFTPTTPRRLLDTRNGTGTGGVKTPLGAGKTLKLAIAGNDGIPASVTGVVLNVTAVTPTVGGFLTVFPDGEARPAVSDVNFGKNQNVPNLVIVPVVNGSIDIYNLAGNTHVLADVAGYFNG
jgi:hypothetical protein